MRQAEILNDYEAVLFRIESDPLAHLGREDVHLINAYFMGYEWGLKAWGQPELPRRISRERLREWQDSKVHLCNQNLQSFCHLLTDTEQDALTLFFTRYRGALVECEVSTEENAVVVIANDQSSFNEEHSALNPELLEAIKKRPAMYFGNRNWIGSLWTMFNGFLSAEKDISVQESPVSTTPDEFQAWIHDRYRISRDRKWWQLYDFLSLGSNQGALEAFFEGYDMFLNGSPSNAPAPWILEAVENVKKAKKN